MIGIFSKGYFTAESAENAEELQFPYLYLIRIESFVSVGAGFLRGECQKSR
jgi:hypothetical protein